MKNCRRAIWHCGSHHIPKYQGILLPHLAQLKIAALHEPLPDA
jgi:hypothetical protein